MKRALGFLAMSLLAAGCGNSAKPEAEAAPAQATGKPELDESRSCIAVYLSQFGWQDIELTEIAESPEMPANAEIAGETWAYTFTASYTNVLGERQTSANWIAIVERVDGRPTVKSCFDNSSHLVGGNRGTELSSTANLTPQLPATDLPAIVAPKP